MAATKQASGDTIGRYRLEEHLGGGGFGSVWRATDTETGDSVALKLLVAVEAAETRAEIELLAATASSASAHVVRVLGGDIDPVPFIVMEYVEGSDLAESLTERGRLPMGEVVAIGLALADALVALERVGIIHRDLKPGNVLLSSSGLIKLADFGIAKIAGLATITSTRQAPMTMAYAAPEVWDGKATQASDLYALGCVLYQCIVGTPPFTGGVGELYKAHAERPADLSALPTNTPPSLRELIRQCLEKDQAARPTNAGRALAMMRRASIEVDDIANAVTTSNEPRRFGPWLRREPFTGRPWSWWCEHESTGVRAIVELHGFATPEDGDVIRRAFEANAELVTDGAEQLLGYNRLLLRPGEAWLSEPPGEFLFWVSREPIDKAVDSSQLDSTQVSAALTGLTNLRETAQRLGVEVEIGPRTLVITADGVRVERPGLPPVAPVDDRAALGWLAAHCNEEADSKLLAGAAGLAAAAALVVMSRDLGKAVQAETGIQEANLGDLETGQVDMAALRTPQEATAAAQAAEVGADPLPSRSTTVPQPSARRGRLLPLTAVGVVGVGAMAGLAMLLGGGTGGGGTDPTPTAVATATSLPLVFEIKSIDCSPATVNIGEPVACDAVIGGDDSNISFEWSAEDGVPAVGTNAKFPTTFTTAGAQKRVTVRACPDNGEDCVEATAVVSVNDPSLGEPPSSAFECTPNPAQIAQPISCRALALDQGLTFNWTAEDATPREGSSNPFDLQFGSPGVKQLSVTVCRVIGDEEVCSSNQQPMSVEAPRPTPRPTAATSGGGSSQPPTPTSIPEPTIVALTCSPNTLKPGETTACSATVQGSATSRTWIASGGSPSSGSAASLSTKYSSAGPKTIVLEVCGPGGCTSDSTSVNVNDEPPPVVSVNCQPASVLPGVPVTCSTNITTGSVTSWSWNVPTGNPATGNTNRLVMTFNSTGPKVVSVTACNGVSCSNATTNILVESPTPSAPPTGSTPPPPINTPVPTPTPFPTAINTNTPAPTATHTSTPQPTNTPTNTPTRTPTLTNTPTPLPTNTPTPTPVPPTPTPTPQSTHYSRTIYVNQAWTDTGIDVLVGDSLDIFALSVAIDHGGGTNYPDGEECPHGVPYDLPCWALIGRIGNGPVFLIGSQYIGVASQSGRLFMGINDAHVADNSGFWPTGITVVR